MVAPVILWFRKDLRLTDHPALAAAAKAGPVLPIYVLDDDTPGGWRMGGASRWWLHGSLVSLAADIGERGGQLHLFRGESAEMLQKLARDAGASGIYFTRGFEPWSGRLEQDVKKRLAADGIECHRYPGTLLHDPDLLTTGQGNPYRVFTPFWKAIKAAPPDKPLQAPRGLDFARPQLASDRLEDWDLLPKKPDWAGGLREAWMPGEGAAKDSLHAFINEALETYADDRNRPDLPSSSRQSPHLHFGEISPRQCWSAVAHAAEGGSAKLERGAESYLRELGWREFCHHLLQQFPALPDEPWREEFGKFPWRRDADDLRAWQRGLTGYPIVDAGMRQLWRTGWMHNRVRLITASFLIKHLMIPWQEGEAWFWDTLVDADLGNNASNWQWVAGSGADAAPYFRIFNPILQGLKFDPEGDYVRAFVPELARVPARHIHAPWEAPAETLAEAGVELGQDYPAPIVEHGMARARALAAFKRLGGSG